LSSASVAGVSLARSQRFRVCQNRSILPQVCGYPANPGSEWWGSPGALDIGSGLPGGPAEL